VLKFPSIYIVKLVGANGFVREVAATLSLSYPISIINRTTAAELGYTEVTGRFQELEELFHDTRFKYFLTIKGIERAYIIKLRQVTLGQILRRNLPVAVLEEEINPHLPIDIILGLNFLKNMQIQINLKEHRLKLTTLTRK